jgi:maltose O-acetyltransferase
MMRKLIHWLRYAWPLHCVLWLTNWLPDNVIFLRLRGVLARPFLGSCGKDLRLGRNVTFYNPSKIKIGSHVYIACGCWFMAGDVIVVEDQVIFGPYALVVSSDHTFQNGSFRYGAPKMHPIRIGFGSWIGGHVTITAGTNIGAGCLVASNAVVVKATVAPRSFLAGVPAQVKGRVEE